MLWSIQTGRSYLLTLMIGVVASAFLVRLFILFHDCVHGSLFPQKRVNTVVGTVLGLLVVTPFEDWRFSHLRHHASYANLDTRGIGDIWTLTRTEYEQASKGLRIAYWIYRCPFVLVGLGALVAFLLRYRLPAKKVKRKEWASVIFTNLIIVLTVLIASQTLGWQTFLLIQLPLIWMAGTAGIFLFYVQHQFKGVYWARREEWDGLKAALVGTSFYNLPPILRWFSGSIGFHHIHHLSSRNVFDSPNGRCGYFTMENILGGSLDKFWNSYGSKMVPIETTVELVKQVCRGLGWLILHRLLLFTGTLSLKVFWLVMRQTV